MADDPKVAGADAQTDTGGAKAEAKATAGTPMSNGQIAAGIATLLVVALLAGALGYAVATKDQPAAKLAVIPPAADPRSPFIEAAPAGHQFVGATKGRHGASCEARGGKVIPDTSKPMIQTARGWARPNRCTADPA